MAKWGEGDPRWIVEERPDATNVNNWHWTEKNASHWSKDKIRDLLTNMIVEDAKVGKCEVTEVMKVEGEASANNRKAKLIFFYEWVIQLKWVGKLNGSDEDIQGEIEIPNLSEEHNAEDVDVNVSIKSEDDNSRVLKELMRTKGTEIIREKLAQYIKDLREEFTAGMILPKTKEAQTQDTPTAETTKVVKNASANNSTTAAVKRLNISGVKISTGSINLTQSFKCTAEEFYRALTVIEMVQAFTQGPCKMALEKGGKFEMFGGNVHGEQVELIPNKRIVQKWRFKQWPDGHYSVVTLDIKEREDNTEVNLVQTGVPLSDMERTKEGWNRYYWESLKKTFGFGALLI